MGQQRAMTGFEERVALVTGGGSGIGRAIVGDLLARGATVVAVDVSGERLAARRRWRPSWAAVAALPTRSASTGCSG